MGNRSGSAAVIIAFPIGYLDFIEFYDADGEYTGFGINFIMSMLLIGVGSRPGQVRCRGSCRLR